MIRDLENNLISLQNEANAHRLILGKSGYGKTWIWENLVLLSNVGRVGGAKKE